MIWHACGNLTTESTSTQAPPEARRDLKQPSARGCEKRDRMLAHRPCRTQANSFSEKPAAANALAACANSFSPSNMPTRTSGYSRSSGFPAGWVRLSLRRRDSHLAQNRGFPSAVLHRAPLTSHLLSDLLVGFFNGLMSLAHAPEPSQRYEQAKHREEDPLVSHIKIGRRKRGCRCPRLEPARAIFTAMPDGEDGQVFAGERPVLLRADY